MDVVLTMEPRTQTVAHRHRTGIQTTVKGGEKRSALYTWPRVVLRGDYAPAGSRENNWLMRKLARYADGTWGVPVWPDKTVLTAQAASGQGVLAVAETAYRHFYEDRQCILVNPADFLTYEVGTIFTLAAQQITLTVNLAATWPAGSWVMPLYESRVAPAQKTDTRALLRRTLEIEATEAYEAARDFSYAAPSSGADTYAGLDLFLQTVEYPLTGSFSRPYDLLQFLGLGYASGRYDAGENALGLKTALVRPTRAEIRETLDFFDARQGRLQSFWMPSWSRDLVATAAILAADTVITVEDVEYETHYLANNVVGRYVYIRFPDGTYVCRKITAADDETPSVTLDSAIGTAVSAGNLSRLLISFLILCRFDIDEMVVEYPQGLPDFGRIEMSVMGLAEETIA